MPNLESCAKSSNAKGNSDNLGVDKNNAGKKYVFTLNNYKNEEVEDLKVWCAKVPKFYIFGFEVGEQGTPHIQGYIELLVKKRYTTIQNECLWAKRAHFETAKGNRDSNITYCSKDNNFITNLPIKKPLKVIQELLPWQEKMENTLINCTNDRAVHWIYDPETGTGKTQFMKYMCNKYKAIFSYGGKKNDVINLVYNNKKYFEYEPKNIVFFNLAKDINPDHISYQSMEQIKDGCISNNKFEAGCFLCNSPTICVLSNILPNTDAMGRGRFILYTISDKQLKNYKIKLHQLDD